MLAPHRGEVQALADLLELRSLLRFGAVFLVTVVAPGLLLAYFSFRSIRLEELQVRDQFVGRADAVAAAGLATAETVFVDFEESVREVLKSGRTPVEGLKRLSDHLLVAVRVGADGAIAAPFDPPSSRPPRHDALFHPLWQEAVRAELTLHDPARAAALYARLALEARGLALEGEAQFARGRALLAAGRMEDAREVLVRVLADFGPLRDGQGFQLGHLAQLKLHEITLRNDPASGAAALQAFVEERLAERWTIGQGAEAALGLRALEMLEDRPEQRDWVRSRRGQLETKAEHLFWAERLYEGIKQLTGAGSSLPAARNEFAWRVVDDLAWTTLRWGDDLYLFALDLSSALSAVDVVLAQMSASDPMLEVRLVPPGQQSPGDLLARRTLAPYLPGWDVQVLPHDPEAIADEQFRRRTRRVAVVLLAVAMISFGAVLTVRLVRRDLEIARLKSDFAANVSHELRSPITQIRLKGESLQLGLAEDETDRQDHYDAIVRESERLSRLVDNILDFAAIERGVKRYAFRPADLAETVLTAVQAVRWSMEARDMDIEVELAPNLPLVVHDPDAVCQVLHNLVSNAAKYGRSGGWIGIRAVASPGEVLVQVADRGMGIRAEDLPRIFEQYFRSADPEARRQKGTGLGLTIVRYIMEAHGGLVQVTSEPGRGTTFTLRFPLGTQGIGGR